VFYLDVASISSGYCKRVFQAEVAGVSSACFKRFQVLQVDVARGCSKRILQMLTYFFYKLT